MNPLAAPAPTRLPRTYRIAALLAALALLGLASHRVSEHRGMQNLRVEASHRLDLLAAAVDGVVNRLEHVPATVELNPEIAALLREPAAAERVARANRYLEAFNRQVGSIAIFVLDAQGVARAASNWNEPGSFVGEDLSFRTYFRRGIAGQTGRHFAIGTTRGEPGYYVSHPVRDGEAVIGVCVVKIGLDQLDETWRSLGTPALIADHNSVVVLSSVPGWRYTALEPLSPEALAEARRTRLYNNREIPAFPIPVDPKTGELGALVEFSGPPPQEAGAEPRPGEYMALGRPLERTGWWLMVFADVRPTRLQALSSAALVVAGSGLLAMLLVIFAQRRRILRQKLEAKALLEHANVELEATVARRTEDLRASNEQLRREIAEREHAQRTLHAAQDELVQAAKLAVLGQLATGITHELTQPLGAIRTLSGNAAEFLRRGQAETADKNLAIINRLADQMGAIIAPLKSFARKSPAVPARVDVARAVGNALFLLDQKLDRAGVGVHQSIAPEQAIAWCDQNRLEQVLVNLIGNATDAMKDQPGERRIDIEAARLDHERLELRVADSGPGLPEAVRAHLFEPFFTTKPAGEGLGLGLAISRDIVREFGGELEALPAGRGACFRLVLPAWHAERER